MGILLISFLAREPSHKCVIWCPHPGTIPLCVCVCVPQLSRRVEGIISQVSALFISRSTSASWPFFSICPATFQKRLPHPVHELIARARTHLATSADPRATLSAGDDARRCHLRDLHTRLLLVGEPVSSPSSPRGGFEQLRDAECASRQNRSQRWLRKLFA